MKPAIELLKELRGLAVQEGKHQKEYHDGQAGGFRVSADLVEAWLREADKWAQAVEREIWTDTKELREDLLGTTRTEGKK